MISKWRHSYRLRKVYGAKERRPFYDLAARYLPSGQNTVVVDIGSGQGEFADYLNLSNRYNNLFLLDANIMTIVNLKIKYKNAILYKAPGNLPFKNASVDYVHCSHLIEHLYPQELYQFIKEIDRVLSINGILCISAPLLWDEFYSDLSHIKPYNPGVFLKYLCGESINRSRDVISERYIVINLVYRYAALRFADDAGSASPAIDFLIYYLRKFFKKLGLKKYVRNGYTLILKKQ